MNDDARLARHYAANTERDGTVAAVQRMAASMQRIAEIHGAAERDGSCQECGHPVPCLSWRLATGST